MKRLLLLASVLVLPTFARAQMPPEAMDAVRTAMERVAVMAGTWEGTGSIMMGPGRTERCNVLEKAEMRLDGTLLVVEGLGTSVDELGGEPRVVHNAFGVISYDLATQKYSFRAYRAGGQFVDSELSVEGDVMKWGFDDPRAGQIRYEITIVPGESWHEIGRISRDGGQNFYQFFEMNLTSVADSSTN